jgi:hypothetical protein
MTDKYEPDDDADLDAEPELIKDLDVDEDQTGDVRGGCSATYPSAPRPK